MNGPRQYVISGNPAVSFSSFRESQVESGVLATPIFHERKSEYVTSARMALARIFQEIGTQSGNKILIPAYNCLSMVLPATSLGWSPVYYRVDSDLSPKISDLEERMDDEVRCIIVVHYFGFPPDMDEIVSFASKHSLILIEDCAHALFGTFNGKSLGTFGDYAICSPWKFLPVLDGGCLLSSDDRAMAADLVNGGLKFQTKVVINSIEHSLSAGKFGILNKLIAVPFYVKTALLKLWKWREREGDVSHAPLSTSGSTMFEEKWMNIRMSRFSYWIIQHVSYSRVVRGRRDNYRKFLRAFAEDERCRSLYPSLPKNVVPYVFPMYVDEGDAVYNYLRSLRIPVFRWEDIPEGVCPVGSEYKSHLIQLPIHQEMSTSDLDWVIDRIKTALDRYAVNASTTSNSKKQ